MTRFCSQNSVDKSNSKWKSTNKLTKTENVINQDKGEVLQR